MATRWRDENGHVYVGCVLCLCQGRILHTVGVEQMVESACPICHGQAYLATTAQDIADPLPPDNDALIMARAVMASSGRCPDCFGYGQNVRTRPDPQELTVVRGLTDCLSCSGTGRLRVHR